jgi:hypothetical protein
LLFQTAGNTNSNNALGSAPLCCALLNSISRLSSQQPCCVFFFSRSALARHDDHLLLCRDIAYGYDVSQRD